MAGERFVYIYVHHSSWRDELSKIIQKLISESRLPFNLTLVCREALQENKTSFSELANLEPSSKLLVFIESRLGNLGAKLSEIQEKIPSSTQFQTVLLTDTDHDFLEVAHKFNIGNLIKGDFCMV